MKSVFMLSACFSLLFMPAFFPSFQNRQVKRQRAQQVKITQRPVRNQVFTETFESPRPFSTAANTDFARHYSISIVDNPVFKGTRSARFELRDTDPMVNNGTRSEVTIIKSGVEREMWYSFAVYFPAEDFAPDSKTEIISQWWQAADKHLGETNAGPATALRIQNDRFVFDTGYNDAQVSAGVIPESRKKIDLGPVTKDSWHVFVFHFIHSYEPDGLIEIWHDDKKVLTHSGGNMYNNVTLPKWKLGIYKWKWNGSETTDTQKRVLYFDNICVGKKKLTFAEMTPASLR